MYEKFRPEIDEGFCVKVYDPDTITVVSKLGTKKWRFSIRLVGIDAPEIRSKSETERQCALDGRDYLSNMILGKHIYMENLGTDKYGRVLCNIYLTKNSNLSINDLLIYEGYARAYDGGHKEEWEDYFKNNELYKTRVSKKLRTTV